MQSMRNIHEYSFELYYTFHIIYISTFILKEENINTCQTIICLKQVKEIYVYKDRI